MAHTFEELVEMQRAADQAHARVENLRDDYGPPTAAAWTEQQTSTYETAWRAWRDLARDVQAAVTAYAKTEGRPRNEVEAEVRKTVRHPDA
ncbi:hypothetical protein [Streptomyces europaeiscabiei]|uniref:WXG100 family type VII secretion target n=1 Tax=Streptomyces europaeiscabiei TaxID=146819 RepID=A0ABU4NSW7_9ACTN|nr:hypothetical protein [Streptomyces europaeiscabiei]MDX3555168.1 hypothetical protein [Streptomyces europaeiscabiei]MDX3705182.1 hypothetical protein [Streptomyces europaeiscabiei]MDX3864407.1 hypothetical protein [Streptomyces europaeiscabiei]MDX3871511.1 hypothetical protein [Streptomyces europaeiscabiei]